MLEIRQAAVDDLAGVAAVQQLAGYNQWSESQLSGSLKHDCCWLVQGETVQGFAIFHIVLDEAELLNIVIDPAVQRQGMGEALLTFCLQALQQQGVGSCLLEVGATNKPAQALYEKLGFSKVGERKNYYQSATASEDAWLMCLTFGG